MTSVLPQPFVDNEDNVVLSDMLFFITNRLNTHPTDIIVACDKFYDEKSVNEEKTKLVLDDIICEIKNRDRTNAFLPIFAAINLHNIRTTDDGVVTNSNDEKRTCL